jgi:hypothetical protein
MMIMRTGRIPEHRAVEPAVLALAMTLTMARVRRTRSGVRQGPEKGMEHSTGRDKRKRKGRGSKTINGKVLLNKPHGEMIYVLL